MLSRVIDEPFRFDPEYYSKSNLMLEDLIKSTNGGDIESYNGKVDCSAFYPSITGFYSDDKSLIPFIRVNEIQAETKLLSELGVDICKFETEVFSVRRYTDILSAERMDAEYFQPKYDKLISTILKYDPKAKTLDDVAIYLFTGEYADKYMLFDKGLCHYVRGTDIYDGIVEIDLFHSVDPQKHSKFVCEGDIVTGRVGTIGNFGVISKELDNSVCSDNVLCFHLPNDYIPNVYALYFNSSIINELTNRMSRGSVQQRMNQETLRELIIPYIKYDTQIELNEIILCSFELMNKSKRLLECAKKAVEMAIEIDEFTAFQWLEDSMRK